MTAAGAVRAQMLRMHAFRSYERAELRLGDGLTVVAGRNGAGKSNLLEAIYFACVGRSCRTGNERECVTFNASLLRLELQVSRADGSHRLTVGFQPGEPKRFTVDDAPVERLLDSSARPLVSVFFPDRLDLILGAPALRRAHLDQLIAALWPARVAARRAYGQVLAQRNAVLGAIRGGRGTQAHLRTWDRQLAHHGLALMADRKSVCERLAPRFAEHCETLGMDAPAELAYRPRSRAATVEALAAELSERHATDIERGFTGFGPHRDDVTFHRAGRDLRAYGSRGQQRLALLALLLAERAELAETRSGPPLLLLDDPMSELDSGRREALVHTLRTQGGQAVIAATELDLVPGSAAADVTRVAIVDGRITQTLSRECQAA